MTSPIVKLLGLISIFATAFAAADLNPIVTKICMALSGAASGAGLMWARQNNVSSEQVAASSPRIAKQMEEHRIDAQTPDMQA